MARSEFAIVGAGALGSILAAHLIRNGRSVALLARGQRAQQLREQGLRIKGLSEIAIPVEVITDPAQLRETGTLIIATKTPGSEQTMTSLRHVQVERALSVQNGVMKDDLLAQTYGRERTLGALADTSGELLRFRRGAVHSQCEFVCRRAGWLDERHGSGHREEHRRCRRASDARARHCVARVEQVCWLGRLRQPVVGDARGHLAFRV